MADRGARLHRVRDKPVIDEVELGDVGGTREGRFRRGFVAKLPVVAEVVRRFVVHGRAAALDRARHVHNRWQLLQIELHKLGRFLGLFKRLGDDRDDGIAHMPHLARSQDRMLGLLHRLPETVRDQPAAGHAARARCVEVFMRVNCDDARSRFRRRGVDGLDAGMRNGGAQDIAMNLVRKIPCRPYISRGP